MTESEKEKVDNNPAGQNCADAQTWPSPAEQSAHLQLALAVRRTELALDNTQLAWVRTAFTFITAGLGIDKGAEALHEARVLIGTNWLTGSHIIGTVLCAASTLLLLIESAAYFQEMRVLARIKGAKPRWLPLALLASLLVVLLGGTLTILILAWRTTTG